MSTQFSAQIQQLHGQTTRVLNQNQALTDQTYNFGFQALNTQYAPSSPSDSVTHLYMQLGHAGFDFRNNQVTLNGDGSLRNICLLGDRFISNNVNVLGSYHYFGTGNATQNNTFTFASNADLGRLELYGNKNTFNITKVATGSIHTLAGTDQDLNYHETTGNTRWDLQGVQQEVTIDLTSGQGNSQFKISSSRSLYSINLGAGSDNDEVDLTATGDMADANNEVRLVAGKSTDLVKLDDDIRWTYDAATNKVTATDLSSGDKVIFGPEYLGKVKLGSGATKTLSDIRRDNNWPLVGGAIGTTTPTPATPTPVTPTPVTPTPATPTPATPTPATPVPAPSPPAPAPQPPAPATTTTAKKNKLDTETLLLLMLPMMMGQNGGGFGGNSDSQGSMGMDQNSMMLLVLAMTLA